MAPLLIVSVLPAAEEKVLDAASRTVPAFASSPPAKLLPLERVNVPEPSMMTLPGPEMLDAVKLPVRLNRSVPLFTTLPEPSEPVAPPLPTCSVPAEIVVPPEYVLAPAMVKVPAPDFVRAPVPEIAPGRVRSSIRL